MKTFNQCTAAVMGSFKYRIFKRKKLPDQLEGFFRIIRRYFFSNRFTLRFTPYASAGQIGWRFLI